MVIYYLMIGACPFFQNEFITYIIGGGLVVKSRPIFRDFMIVAQIQAPFVYRLFQAKVLE